MAPSSEPSQRLDQWLCYARFVKTRSRAAALCVDGRLRVNRRIVEKSHHAVRVGDILTLPLGRDVRVIRVLALADRRGPAREASLLYEEIEA